MRAFLIKVCYPEERVWSNSIVAELLDLEPPPSEAKYLAGHSVLPRRQLAQIFALGIRRKRRGLASWKKWRILI